MSNRTLKDARQRGNVREDHWRAITAIEDEYRHDLAVHLYLTYLQHQVNPFFPLRTWALWPQDPENTTDPGLASKYSDIIVDELFRFMDDFPEGEISKRTPPLHIEGRVIEGDELLHAYKRSRRDLWVVPKTTASNRKSLLVNEIHAVIQRKIHEKAQRLLDKQREELGVQRDQIAVDANPEIARQLALRLANKLTRLQGKLAKHPVRSNIKPRNWQDVLIANMLVHDPCEKPQVASYKRSYEKARAFFTEPFKYEYDENLFDGEVPEFNVEDHLQAIEDGDWTPPVCLVDTYDLKNDTYSKVLVQPWVTKKEGIRLLKEQRKEMEYKENLFIKLWDLAATQALLSWNRSDHDGRYLVNNGVMSGERSEMAKERQDALNRYGVALDLNDFYLTFRS